MTVPASVIDKRELRHCTVKTKFSWTLSQPVPQL